MRTLRYWIVPLYAAMLYGCVSTPVEQVSTEPIGKFFQAGPRSAPAPEMSVQWVYGFQFSVDPSKVTQAKLSCDPLPGSTFDVVGVDLNIKADGKAIWKGPVLVVSKETTPWMLDFSSDTTAICTAMISRAGQPDALQQVPVKFAWPHKALLMDQMKKQHAQAIAPAQTEAPSAPPLEQK